MNRKVNSEGEKAGEEGGLNPSIKFCPSIKKVVFKKMYSHRKRRARKADERLSCLFALSLSLFSFSGLFFSPRQGTRLAVSDWLNWEKHQYPFIHTITHIEHHCTVQRSSVSNLSPQDDRDLWQVPSCDYRGPDRHSSPLLLGDMYYDFQEKQPVVI